MMPDHNYFANLIWQIADLLRGPYRPPQYERVIAAERTIALLKERRSAVIAAPVTGQLDLSRSAA